MPAFRKRQLIGKNAAYFGGKFHRGLKGFVGVKSVFSPQEFTAGIRNPAEIAGFCDSEETYNRLKAEAMDKILKAAPKALRARLASGDF